MPGMKKFAWRQYPKIFLEVIFSHSKTLFSKFPYIVLLDIDIIDIVNFPLSISKS